MGFKMENKKNMLKKYKFIFMIFLCFVLCFNIVNANIYWGQSGNSNYQSEGGNSFIYYGSNSQNPAENLTYSKVSLVYSNYEPVVADLNVDGNKEIVLTDLASNTIKIFNTAGDLINTLNLDEDITSHITLSSQFAGTRKNLNILTNESFFQYGYFNSVVGFKEYFNVDYADYIWWDNVSSLDKMFCDSIDSFDNCILLRTGDDVIYHIDIGSMYFTNTSNRLTHSLDNVDMDYNGLTTIRGIGDIADWGIVCNMIGSCRVSCDLINVETGIVENSFSTGALSHIGSSACDSQNIVDLKFGGGIQDGDKRVYLNYIFGYSHIGSSYERDGLIVFDLNGNVLFSDNTFYNDYSNPAIADFNKDGKNEFCYFKHYTGSSDHSFSCYDSDFNLVFSETSSVYYGSTIAPKFAMGDFMSEDDNMCLAMVEGIFCFNETNNSVKVFDSGYSTGDAYPVVVEIDDDGYLGYVYADDDKGFIVLPDVANYSACGNGICDDWENDFTCYVDCHSDYPDAPEVEGEYLVGTHCESDSDCAGNLKCEYGVCSLSGFNEECSTNAECLSGECVAGYCTKSGLWALLSASKTQQFGDDTHTNNFISLIIIISVASAVGIYLNIWGGIMVLFSLGIFFTLVGWLSAFILVGFFIVGIIALVFGMMLPKR